MFSYKILSTPQQIKLAYIEEGAHTETLLFIHGLAASSFSWMKNIPALSKQYKCIAIDLPGNGHSDYGDYDYDISFFVACIKEFVVELGLKKFSLVGHSLGGQIAIQFAATYPELLHKLILVAPAGLETFTAFEKQIYQTNIHFFNFFSSDENSLAKSIMSGFYHYTGQADALIEHLQAHLKKYPSQAFRKMIEKTVDGMLSEPIFHLLNQIHTPALVIFGERDTFIPNRLIHPFNTKKIAEEGVAALPHAVLEMIPYGGHYIQWEQSDVVNELIDDFMKK